jgi:hypothetical protein
MRVIAAFDAIDDHIIDHKFVGGDIMSMWIGSCWYESINTACSIESLLIQAKAILSSE